MARANPEGLPRVYDYEDPRAFLRDWYRARKRADPRYSYTAFAMHAGIRSRSHYCNVANGRANLSPWVAESFSKALRLGKEEAEYFSLLVAAGQATSHREREMRLGELRFWLWSRSLVTAPPEMLKRVPADWPMFLVFCLTVHRDFRPDPRWVSRRLGGRLSPALAARALASLRRTGLIRTKGRRLVGTLAGLSFWCEGDGDAASARWARNVLQDASAFLPRRPQGFFTIHAVLTPAEAAAVREAMQKAALQALPKRKAEKVSGDLCAIFGSILPFPEDPRR